jgi:Flp pilus assembly pilin Flp
LATESQLPPLSARTFPRNHGNFARIGPKTTVQRGDQSSILRGIMFSFRYLHSVILTIPDLREKDSGYPNCCHVLRALWLHTDRRRHRHTAARPGSDTDHTLDKDHIMTKISAFLNDETGAVTVDWVVLTAAIVGLGLVVFNFVRPAVSNVAQQIGTELEEAKTCMTSNGTTC